MNTTHLAYALQDTVKEGFLTRGDLYGAIYTRAENIMEAHFYRSQEQAEKVRKRLQNQLTKKWENPGEGLPTPKHPAPQLRIVMVSEPTITAVD